jgi:hypothetical protein
MSPRELKPGDRVRLRANGPRHGRQAGERGTLLRVVSSSLTGELVDGVAVDEDDSGLEYYFLADDIEADV